MEVSTLKFGCDPEFFVKKDGEHTSAYGLIPGTKTDPLVVPNGAVQVDGMALEFNIDPVSSVDNFVSNISSVLGTLREMVPTEYEFDYVPVAHFSPDYLKSLPMDATKLGCEPDFNAATGEQNPTPNSEVPFRTASGHIHIGWVDNIDKFHPEHIEACRMLVRQLDSLLGQFQCFWDSDTIRPSLYGKLGAFRPKSYGVEYRVLSNAWLTNPLLMEFVYNVCNFGTQRLLEGMDYSKEWFLEGRGEVRLRNRWDYFAYLTERFWSKELRDMFKARRDELGGFAKTSPKKTTSNAYKRLYGFEPAVVLNDGF